MSRQFIDRYGHLFRSARRIVENKSANYTVTLADNGKIFTASAAVTFTLPDVAAAKGCSYIFYKTAAGDMSVAGAVGEIMVGHNNATADSILVGTDNEEIGTGLEVVSNGSVWLTFMRLGAEAVTTTVTDA